MNHLIVHRKPETKFDHLIVAFAGWPDAGESATSTVKYMVRQLGAAKFAEIDPEEFYDFSQERPQVLPDAGWPPPGALAGQRVLLLAGPPARCRGLGQGRPVLHRHRAKPEMAHLFRNYRQPGPGFGREDGSPLGRAAGRRSPHPPGQADRVIHPALAAGSVAILQYRHFQLPGGPRASARR